MKGSAGAACSAAEASKVKGPDVSHREFESTDIVFARWLSWTISSGDAINAATFQLGPRAVSLKQL